MPNGYVERAVIHIVEDEDKEDRLVYTIITNPLTGETEVYREFKEINFEEKMDDE